MLGILKIKTGHLLKHNAIRAMGLWDCWVARMQLTANTQFVEGLRTCMSNIAIVSMPLNSSVLEKLDTVKI